MSCPHTHLWYELERGRLPREDADRLRQHLAECVSCRTHAEGIRQVAAGLERMADRMRHDLPQPAEESLHRRARMRGLLGRPPKAGLLLRMNRSKTLRIAVPAAMMAAAAVLVIVGLQIFNTADIQPKGSLKDLVGQSARIDRMEGLSALAKAARAAVSEELSRSSPALDQVSDLLLVSYIAQHPKEKRQADDVRFLISSAWSRRFQAAPMAAAPAAWPMLASVAVVQAGTPSPADATLVGRNLLLAGDYENALAALPVTQATAVQRAWCLESLGRSAEAEQVLSESGAVSPLVRLMRADLALQSRDVGMALREFETLATSDDRFWFTAGYICRYELADPRSAGLRFQRVKDPEMAAYVAKKFGMELLAAGDHASSPLFVEDFDAYPAGTPSNWALVQTRGSEFRVVDVPHGRALQQDEVDFRGAEFLTGDPEGSDYTLQVEVKILEAHGNDYTIGAAAYRRADNTGYVLELSHNSLRVAKQFASRQRGRRDTNGSSEPMQLEPGQAQIHLAQPPAVGWWYTLKLRVQKVDGGTNVAGKFWRSDIEEPLQWQVVWTDTGQGGVGPISGGAAGIQINGAKVLIDNFILLRNEPLKAPPAGR
jgi:hypothetical protein